MKEGEDGDVPMIDNGSSLSSEGDNDNDDTGDDADDDAGDDDSGNATNYDTDDDDDRLDIHGGTSILTIDPPSDPNSKDHVLNIDEADSSCESSTTIDSPKKNKKDARKHMQESLSTPNSTHGAIEPKNDNNNNHHHREEGTDIKNQSPTRRALLALINLLQTPEYAALRRKSRTLDQIYTALEDANSNDTANLNLNLNINNTTNVINTPTPNTPTNVHSPTNTSSTMQASCLAEFIETLDERAKEAAASCEITAEKIRMKKEALLVGGDMSSAIKMLREHALPTQQTYGLGTAGGNGAVKANTEMLACILEFLLDMCEGGELSLIGFFWSQLCQIHMQMLPPTDAESLRRAELMEDFLLTVCVKHSVQLSLELVWSCLADLEEGLGPAHLSSASCRRRRFAMMRFVCELESLIFDYDGGWGGGTICLRKMLVPSVHQEALIKDAMGVLQLHRRFGSHHLTRSGRLDKLKADALAEELMQLPFSSSTSLPPTFHPLPLHSSPPAPVDDMKEAERKYHIARNAEYFSTQLMFSRRLGDIAEGLRFMELSQRTGNLVTDLEGLNFSGRLGGDPLNQICESEHGLVNVLHIPSNEGHVFRSKERTPVLLLMETMRDLSLFATSDGEETNNVGGGGGSSGGSGRGGALKFGQRGNQECVNPDDVTARAVLDVERNLISDVDEESLVRDQVTSEDGEDSCTNTATTTKPSAQLNEIESNADVFRGSLETGEEKTRGSATVPMVDYESAEDTTIDAASSNSNDKLNDSSSGTCLLRTPKDTEGVTRENSKNMENLVVKMMQEKLKMSITDLEPNSSSDDQGEEQSGCTKQETRCEEAGECSATSHHLSPEDHDKSSNEKEAVNRDAALPNFTAEDHAENVNVDAVELSKEVSKEVIKEVN